MKTTTKFLLACAGIVFGIAMANAQCSAGYTWAQTSNNVIAFTNTSSPISQQTNFYWDFGDQQYANQQTPTHTYNVPGTYVACVTMMDSLNNSSCYSTFCDTIVVTGTVICNLAVTAYQQTPASCVSCSDGVASVYATGGTAPFTYSWSNSATTSTASGLAVGTYTVCVTDANGCNACSTVNIAVNACVAGFTWNQTSNNVISFTNTSTPYVQNSTYFIWNFGDNQSDQQQNPVHTYSVPGTYYVCVTIYNDTFNNNNYCTATFCDSITVTGSVLCNVSVGTSVLQGASCVSCADGSAYAYMNGGTAPYTYSWSDGQTTQVANNLLSGVYSVCMTDANGCSACDSIYVPVGNVSCHANFTIWLDTANTQQAWIYNYSTGGPNTTYTWFWGDNTSSTGMFASHVYSTTGQYTICLFINDSVNNCSDSMCQVIMVPRLTQQAASQPFYVNCLGPTGIKTADISTTFSVYPNPAESEIKITANYSLQGKVYHILDVAGREILNGKLDANSINVTSLDKGMYFLQVENAKGGFSTQRFMKD